jgi:short subunit dehydrogenase-like uncharacterized protein
MIERYHALAKQNGALIVPFAGFDSVPSDIGVYLLAREMSQKHSQRLASVDLVYRIRGGLNGGTAATALDLGKKLTSRDEANLNFMTQLPARIEARRYQPRYVAQLKQWVAPFFMEPINNKIVYRSVALAPDAFEADFSYRECIATPGGLVGAASVAWSLGAAQSLLKTTTGRRLAALVFPKPGSGPSEEQMADGFFHATFVATGAQSQVVVRKMVSKGDPGNVSTVKLLLACVRALFSPGFAPPSGVLTPAIAFGETLLPALEASEISWS